MSTPFRRDILKELSEAAQRAGCRLLLPSIMDGIPGYLRGALGEGETARGGAVFDRYVDYMKAQLRELLTGTVARVLWFDGSGKTPEPRARIELYEYVRSLQPKIFVNTLDVGRGGDAG